MSASRRHDDGSLVVELVVLTPVLFGFALLTLVFGRITEAQQQITESSRAAVQAAAVMTTPASAQLAASENAVVGVRAKPDVCAVLGGDRYR